VLTKPEVLVAIATFTGFYREEAEDFGGREFGFVAPASL
jgi:hypothetical protein